MNGHIKHEHAVKNPRDTRDHIEVIECFMLLVFILKTIKKFNWHDIALGELYFLGQKMTTPPFGINLATGVAVHVSQTQKAGKIQLYLTLFKQRCQGKPAVNFEDL